MSIRKKKKSAEIKELEYEPEDENCEEDDWDDYCYKNFTNATTTVYAKNNTKTINKLTSGKYYVRIRANEKNHYGAWSSIKSIKVK